MTRPSSGARTVAAYVPDVVRGWGPDDRPHRQVDGALVSADISGFTALSERLAGFGREGAEELTVLLNQCFGGMIEIIDEYGGDVLKFGGDALLVLFAGDGAAARAVAACVRMRSLIERSWSTPLVKRVRLGISQGVHAGTFDLHLVDAGHRELLVVGPGMSTTVRCEGAAGRGQILVSDAAAEQLDPDILATPTSDEGRRSGRLVERAPTADRAAGRTEVAADAPIEAFVPRWLVHQADAGPVAEHRTVTVGFVFVDGVDDLLADEGADAAHARLQALASAVDEAVARHGAFWLASDAYPGGGKIILAAGAPRSTRQDEDAAVRTAHEVIRADVGLPLRVGLNRGAVFMADLGSQRRCTFTVMGDAVNLAARLMQAAQPGQLVASDEVLRHVPTRFDVERLAPFAVKGKSEPIHASVVGGMRSDGPAPGRPSTDEPVPFVGRQREIDFLESELAAAVGERGRAVVITGEPGIGKSRIVAELLAAHDDVDRAHAMGGLYSRRTPYFAVSNMLRRLVGIERTASPSTAGRLLALWVADHVPDLEPWLPLLAIALAAEVPTTPEVERIAPANRAARLRDATLDLMVAAMPGPAVLVVDDAHRLDEASEELLATLVRGIDRHPWLLLVLREAGQRSFADDVGVSTRLEVGPLAAESSMAIARHAAAVDGHPDDDHVDSLVARGVTNPLFLLELVRSGIGQATEMPGSIEAVVTARIDTLDAADRLLLREASVLGSVVDTTLLAGALGSGELRGRRRWASLSGFLEPDSGATFRFRESLYREVAYQGLSFRRRRQIHALVGRELERRAGEDWANSSELLSLHFHEARDWERSWRYSVIAGDRARSKYAHAEAADFYDRALGVPRAARPDPAAVAAVAESLADAAELDAQFERADRALALARGVTDDPVVTVRLMRKEGVLRERSGKYTQALRWYGRGLTAARRLPGTGAPRAEAELCLAYAGVRFRQGRLHDTISWAHRAERLAQELDDRRMLAHSAYLLMIGYGMLRRPEVADYRRRPLELYEELGDLVGQANVLNNLGADAKDESRWTEALELYERSRRAREAAGDVVGAATANLNIAEILSDQGHLDEAERLLGDALRAWRRADYTMGIHVATSYLGRLAARRGDIVRARRLLEEAMVPLERIGATLYVLETKTFQLECMVLAGQGREAIEAAGPVQELAAEFGDPLVEAMVVRARGWAHLVLREWDEAEALAERCLALATEVGSQYERALALIMRGQVKEATGRDRTADHREARRLLEELGVVSLPRRAA